MTSPGGRIEIRVDPDLRGFGNDLSRGLTASARTGVAAFASAAKTALLGAAVGIGVAGIVAAKSTLSIGIEYQNQLNTLQAVSGATEAQMKSVGQTAIALGNDLTLPATSAADAAAVMTELAKANFSVDDAQKAAKGSLQLAAAAQIDGARAATIQANAINAFSLKATDAARVADVLANAANASSAEITDVADALQQASAVAASAHISIEDTATVIGILANNGIKGSDAGTLLKSALLALQSPSKQAQAAMSALNLTAYDSKGRFVGLKSIFEQLQTAQGKMTQQQYEMATSTLFGSDAARLAGIAAKEGGKGFDEMAKAIGRQGAAADVAAAKSKGLGGALQAFQSQVETIQIDVFTRAAPSLEKFVRLAAARLPDVANAALDAVDRTVGYFQQVAPRIGKALDARRQVVATAWQQLGKPIISGAEDLASKGLDVIVNSAQRLSKLAGDAVHTVEPLAQAVGRFETSLSKAGGPLDTVDAGLGLLAKAGGLAIDVLGPFVRLAGNAVDIVSGLPGPLESAVVGLVALKVASNIDFFSGRGAAAVTAVGGAVKSTGASVRALSGEVAVQQALFAAQARDAALAAASVEHLARAEQSASVWAAAAATATEASAAADAAASARRVVAINQLTGSASRTVPALSAAQMAMRGWDTQLAGAASTSEQASGKLGKLGAVGATLATKGLAAAKTAGAGLVSLLGGPWGVAVVGATLGIGALTAVVQHHNEEIKADTAAVTEWQKAIALGGTGSVDAARHLDELRAKIAANQAAIDAYNAAAAGGNARGGIGTLVSQQKELQGELANGTKAAQDQLAAMTPLEIATQQVATAQYDLGMALKSGNPAQVTIAQQALAAANGELARETDLAAQAQKSQTQIQNEAVAAALASTNSDVAAREAQIALSQQITASAQAISQYGANSDRGRQATDQLTNAALAAANAAGAQAAAHSTATTAEGKQADSDAALLKSLQATAHQLGANTPAAITQLIASLQASGATGAQTAVKMRDLGLAVTQIPNTKSVVVDAPTKDQEARIAALGYHVTHLPDGKVLVSASTGDAEAALNYLTRTRNVYVKPVVMGNGNIHVAGGQLVAGAAEGGYTGPGGKYEVAPVQVHRGEYIQPKDITNIVGLAGMRAIHRGDWRAAAARFSALAEGTSRSTVARMAARQAAATAGSYAAGGYVDAQARMAQQVVTVPQTVDNRQYNHTLHAAPSLPTIDQLRRMQRRAEVLARA